MAHSITFDRVFRTYPENEGCYVCTEPLNGRSVFAHNDAINNDLRRIHDICEECLRTCLANHSSCPICRLPVKATVEDLLIACQNNNLEKFRRLLPIVLRDNNDIGTSIQIAFMLARDLQIRTTLIRQLWEGSEESKQLALCLACVGGFLEILQELMANHPPLSGEQMHQLIRNARANNHQNVIDFLQPHRHSCWKMTAAVCVGIVAASLMTVSYMQIAR